MKGRFPILPARYAAVILVSTWLGDQLHSLAHADEPVEAQSLIAEAAQRMNRLQAMEARIRQRVNMFGQQLVGAGTYIQFHDGKDLLTRLDLKIQLAGRAASLQQVRNRRYLWTRRSSSEEILLGRSDLKRLQQAIDFAKSQGKPLDPTFAWNSLSGISQLLVQLEADFRFKDAVAREIGDAPVWVVEGKWKPERLAAYRKIPGGVSRSDQKALPPQIPQMVRLVLGRDDALPLFPYRIEFGRNEDANLEPADAWRPIMAIEFFEVQQLENVNPLVFEYEAGDQDVVDLTDRLLERLGVHANQ